MNEMTSSYEAFSKTTNAIYRGLTVALGDAGRAEDAAQEAFTPPTFAGVGYRRWSVRPPGCTSSRFARRLAGRRRPVRLSRSRPARTGPPRSRTAWSTRGTKGGDYAAAGTARVAIALRYLADLSLVDVRDSHALCRRHHEVNRARRHWPSCMWHSIATLRWRRTTMRLDDVRGALESLANEARSSSKTVGGIVGRARRRLLARGAAARDVDLGSRSGFSRGRITRERAQQSRSECLGTTRNLRHPLGPHNKWQIRPTISCPPRHRRDPRRRHR